MAYKKDTQKTPTSIFEIKLLVNKIQEKELFKYSDCARMHYNAVLGEALKRLNKVQKEVSYSKASYNMLDKYTKKYKKIYVPVNL